MIPVVPYECLSMIKYQRKEYLNIQEPESEPEPEPGPGPGPEPFVRKKKKCLQYPIMIDMIVLRRQ